MRPQAERSYRWLFWSLALVGFALDQGSKYGVFAWLYNDGHGGYYPLLHGPQERLLSWEEHGFAAGRHNGFIAMLPDGRSSDAMFGLRAEFTWHSDPGTSWLSHLRTWGGERQPHVNKGALFGVGNADDGRDFNTAFLVISFGAAAAIVVWSVRRCPLADGSLCVALGLILAGTLGNLYDRIVFSGVRDFLHWNYLVNWPVFNIADCCLVCGATLLLWQAVVHQPQAAADAAACGSTADPLATQASAVHGTAATTATNGQVPDASAPGNCSAW